MSTTTKLGGPIPTLISVDPTKPAHEQRGIHNRWHPDIPSFVKVAPGQAFKIECHEWTGGQIGNNDSADDIHTVDLTQVHNLSGPVEIEGAEPGDILEVDILDVQPFSDHPWGFTGIFDLHNGGGLFAREFSSTAAKAIWDFEGIYATSRHIPGVKFAGISHPGLIGCAPDAALLARWNEREAALVEKHAVMDNGKTIPAVAYLPQPEGAYVGVKESDEGLVADDVLRKIKTEGARTIPPREHGGNVDIKNLSRGSKVYFPVYVKGAKLSMGDLHFSQGDGEMSFCGAIEMAGILTLKTSLIKGGVAQFGQTMPMFIPSPIDPLYSARLIFQGISVDMRALDGSVLSHIGASSTSDKASIVASQYSMDATVAYKQAALNCIEYLVRLGYTRDQAYLLLSAAPVDSHVAGLVDSPNACVTMSLPLGIFEFDILPPREGGLVAHQLGRAATTNLSRAR